MTNEISHLSPYFFIIFVAFTVNILCGYIREATPKFSLPWFFWIHASIPILIYLRIALDVSSWFVFANIALAVAGQIVGSRWRRAKMTQKDIEATEQIPENLIIPKTLDHVKDEDVLVALLNMGGPKTNADVPDFQRRLFNDRLLIRFPLSAILQPFFAWALVTFRAKASQERYQLIGGGSPIYNSTQGQVEALSKELRRRGRKLDVTFSFNYSPPLPEATVDEAKNLNKKYVLPLSLYPHYSTATTGSNLFYLKEAARKKFPQLAFLPTPAYYLKPSYISAFVDRIYDQLQSGESLEDFYLIFSAHGLPLYSLAEGDPYAFQISQTTASILAKLNRDRDWVIAYQSAVGPLQWLKPSVEAVLEALAKRGVKKVIIVPVAFVGDHIETTCEIGIEYKEVATKLGIMDFRMTKALETHPGFIAALADAVENVLPKHHAGFVDSVKRAFSNITN